MHLLRGLIGRPGCGVLQMNGQPTAQNNRECGADGDLPGFRNWDNEEHIDQLARLWDVDPLVIPHWAPPTHAMQIFRYAEQGSIGLLWIAGTNPAVSMPELPRVRELLGGDQCFVVVADGYHTETTELADVVLPAALWGEKTGTYTNADRTVHLSDQAVTPPGQARSDLDIFLDYARRMGFTDNSGRPLPGWSTPEEAFEEWKQCSRGRPCDYSGITYPMLRERGGVQWPCTADRPGGTERLYSKGRFNTDTETAENYGHDLVTGATITRTEHRALQANGRAFLKGAAFSEPKETPDDTYPMLLTTGRTVYHFHTRTKTGRAPQLNDAAPHMWVEIAKQDADEHGIEDGDTVRIISARGSLETPARVCDVRPGQVFAPFHYGDHAANELTMTVWDPVSKQPAFKVAAVRMERLDRAEGTGPRAEGGTS
jgi:anaerobic selenocysteine-containing dehydrogenase